MMDRHIGDFTNHLAQAIEIGKKTAFKQSQNTINSVLICGLGGSGIGGTIISQLIKQEIKVPVVINKDYFIPEFVNKNTLVVCSSYSGNTEETLSMYEQARAKGAEIAIVTSGGKFEEIAKSEMHNIIVIPGGLPPRAAFGLAFPQLFYLLNQYQLINNSFEAEFQKSIELIDNREAEIKAEAKVIAAKLYNKFPIIYSGPELEGVCVRFRQQINENSKRLALHHTLPEMNHNELVGWKKKNEDSTVLFFKTKLDYYRNVERENYSKEVISKYAGEVVDINGQGESLIVNALYLIHLGDWISELLGQLNQVDTTEVNIITGLKNMLGDLD